MNDEVGVAFRAYVWAWVAMDFFDQKSILYDSAWEEICTIENSESLNMCQIRVARKVAQAIWRDATVVFGR